MKTFVYAVSKQFSWPTPRSRVTARAKQANTGTQYTRVRAVVALANFIEPRISFTAFEAFKAICDFPNTSRTKLLVPRDARSKHRALSLLMSFNIKSAFQIPSLQARCKLILPSVVTVDIVQPITLHFRYFPKPTARVQ